MKKLSVLLLLCAALVFTACAQPGGETDTTAPETEPAVTGAVADRSALYSGPLEENGRYRLRALDYVTLPTLSLTVPAEIHTVTEDETAAQIGGILTRFADKEIRLEREVRVGDTVNISYVGTIDGVAFEGGSTGESGTDVVIGYTSYIDDDIESGHRYRYTVRCVTADGNSFTSDCDTTGVSIYYVSPPRLLNAETDLGTVKLTWSKPSGAARYRVYKRVSGSWRRLGDTTSNTYTDNDVTTGETYKYAVRVVSSDGEDFYSGFDPDGFVVTVVAQTGDFVYYDQGDYSYPYGDDTIAYSGCGPTCFAMIASTILGRRITPIDAVKWCGNSYYVYNVGTRWDYFTAASDHFGIKMEKQLSSSQFSSVITALKQGKYVISAQSAGIFTSGGHFIVLSGITSDGRIIVYDPNGGNHYAGTKFAQSSITASGTQYWVFDKK